jgi:hypothetical protein
VPYVRRRQRAASLNLYDDDESTQVAAVWDHFAIGRGDARALLLIRDACRSLRGNGLRAALFALAHLAPYHPDIWRKDENHVPAAIRSAVCPHLRWPTEDIAHFLNELQVEEFARAASGLDLLLLLQMDYDQTEKLRRIATGQMASATMHAQTMAVVMLLDGESREEGGPIALLDHVVELNPKLASEEFIAEIRTHIREHKWVILVD